MQLTQREERILSLEASLLQQQVDSGDLVGQLNQVQAEKEVRPHPLLALLRPPSEFLWFVPNLP